MTAKDVIKGQLGVGLFVVRALLDDLSDADLLARPVPGANHTAWQLGHVLLSGDRLFAALPGGQRMAFPAGFAEAHAADAARRDEGFPPKAEYQRLLSQFHEVFVTNLANTPDADLDKPHTGPLAKVAPTLGAVFSLTAGHLLMHAGQFSAVRRKLGKPNVM